MVMVAIGRLREQPRPERTALPGYEFRMSGRAYDMYGTVRTKRREPEGEAAKKKAKNAE